MRVKRALVCAYGPPQTDRDSGSRRVFDLMAFLQEAGWTVAFISSNPIGDVRYATALQQRGVAVYDGSTSSIEEVLGTVHFDLALIAFWPIAELYLPIIRRISPVTRVIVDSVDLHFLRDARRIFNESIGERAPSLLDSEYASNIIGELNAYAAADAVLTVSTKEADLINDLISDASLALTVPDCENLKPSTVPFAERRGILFLGSYQHPPNVQAVEYLCKRILPRLDAAILDEHPLYVVGNDLNDAVRDYGRGLSQVRMVGWVPSVTPYFEQARITVLPLLYGAGTKRKMVQALMIGTPTVSTSIGTEGLNLQDREQVLIADDEETFAKSITRLLKDQKLWHALARKGQAHIAKTHSREAAQVHFLQAITVGLAKDPKPGMLLESGPKLYHRRLKYQYYQQAMRPVRQAVSAVLPRDARLIIVGEGGNELLNLDVRTTWHFPQSEDGAYSSHYPADSAAAIDQLEALREKGADFLIFPSAALWWLDHYKGFRQHLEGHYREIVRLKDACLIYSLCESPSERSDVKGRLFQPDLTDAATDQISISVDARSQVSHNGTTKRMSYQQLVRRIRQAANGALPPDCTVMVVSKGDDELLDLDGRKAWHFPQTDDGTYSGYYPSDSSAAIGQLEALREKGGEFLIFPSTALWWLEHYKEFHQYLESHCRVVLNEKDNCLIYSLIQSTRETSPPMPITILHSTPLAGIPNGSGNGSVIKGLTTNVTGSLTYGNGTESNKTPSERDDVKLMAFYLPQFHPIPENDEWWGTGFTEWTNVVRTRPQFRDHYQPQLPADLGFYDLRLEAVRQAQADMARIYGIHGFSYYHYWFNGKLLLEHPFNAVLNSGGPNLPFCLCWANEPWSRRWDGRPRDVLQPQTYSEEDDVAHIRWLMPALADPRAIKIEGKPVFLVYQGRDLPNPLRTVDTWREEVLKAGLEGIYLIAVETGWDAGWDATKEGFDAKLLFQPQFAMLFNSGAQISIPAKPNLRVFDYQKAWPILANPEPVSYRRYDTVFPSWDNSARKGDDAVVVHNSSPEAYEQWLRLAIGKAQTQPEDHRIVFINAWNEWAEGAHLEPDTRHGRAYLEATKRAKAASVRIHSAHDPIIGKLILKR